MNIENYILNFAPLDSDFDENRTQINLVSISFFTKANYKLFYSALRSKYKTYKSYGNCGHDYDCCGCVSSEHNDITFTKDATIVVSSIQLNY